LIADGAVEHFPAKWNVRKLWPTGDICMTTLFSVLDWRAMSQEARDLGLNNGVAVPGSVDMVAGWEQRSVEMRKRFPAHLDLRYGPRERNRIDFLKAADGAPTLLFIHGGYWQARAKEVFTVMAEGPMTHGINVALIGYTLAPEATLDEIVAEIHAGIDYLTGQLPALGAAPGGIVVSGWSAGGHLTSMALSHPKVRAGMAISGIYDLEPIRHSYLNEKLRADEATSARNSPMMQEGRSAKSRCRWWSAAPNCRSCASRPPISPATARGLDCR
jgi:acetyl esterase/lipase